VIGQGKTDFKCLDGACSEHFSLSTLQHVLSVNIFSIVLRKMQEEEIQKADIPDLVSCPFCSFATIMPDQNDKVFKCLNPECLKESCR
jgi:TRIAD3 protein (E3 ubiquitin-protein ligase RNF216)